MDPSIETKETDVFNRDQVLSQIDQVFNIQDQTEKTKHSKQFIDNRLKLLTETTTPAEFMVMTKPKKGFLHPESGVRRSLLVDPFFVDDPEIYQQLIDTFEEFKTNKHWQGRTLREIAPYAILRTIGNYFGNHWTANETENNNRAFYLDRSGAEAEAIHLQELKGKNIAVCPEKAAVAQNLLSFLGYESELVASPKCRLESAERDDLHMYNIITDKENHMIFDPTNPIMIKNAEEKMHTVMPSFYPIDQEMYERLMSGGQVEVIHNDGSWDGEKNIKGPDQRRTYGGPSNAIV